MSVVKTPRFITKITIIREINICITKLSEEAVREQIIFSLILKKWPPQNPPKIKLKMQQKIRSLTPHGAEMAPF